MTDYPKGFYEFQVIHPVLDECINTIRLPIAALPELIKDMQDVVGAMEGTEKKKPKFTGTSPIKDVANAMAEMTNELRELLDERKAEMTDVKEKLPEDGSMAEVTRQVFSAVREVQKLTEIFKRDFVTRNKLDIEVHNSEERLRDQIRVMGYAIDKLNQGLPSGDVEGRDQRVPLGVVRDMIAAERKATERMVDDVRHNSKAVLESLFHLLQENEVLPMDDIYNLYGNIEKI